MLYADLKKSNLHLDQTGLLNLWMRNVHIIFFILSVSSLLFHFSLLLLMFWWAVWLPWFQMFLISQMPGMACNCTPTCYSVSLMPHRAARTQTSTCTHTCVYTNRACMRECKVLMSGTEQLLLPAWEEKLPVASLQTAAGQPRYQPISSAEAVCRKLAWLPLGEKLRNIMRQHDKFIWG